MGCEGRMRGKVGRRLSWGAEGRPIDDGEGELREWIDGR